MGIHHRGIVAAADPVEDALPDLAAAHVPHAVGVGPPVTGGLPVLPGPVLRGPQGAHTVQEVVHLRGVVPPGVVRHPLEAGLLRGHVKPFPSVRGRVAAVAAVRPRLIPGR